MLEKTEIIRLQEKVMLNLDDVYARQKLANYYEKNGLQQIALGLRHPAAADIASVMWSFPTLNSEGMARRRGRRKTEAELHEFFLDTKVRLLASGSAFERTKFWLVCQKQIRSFNKMGSYGLKHIVENDISEYCSNGTFIAAVISLGIPFKHYPGNLSIRVAISNKLVTPP